MIEGNKIKEIAEDIPALQERRLLMPGEWDYAGHSGCSLPYRDVGGWNRFEGADGNEETDPVTPHLRAIDGINPGDNSFREARNTVLQL